jgi:methyl-accepting chemotaxis protein PixJ
MLKIRSNQDLPGAFLAETSLPQSLPNSLRSRLPKFKYRVLAIAIALGTVPSLVIGVISSEMIKREVIDRAVDTQQITAQMASVSIQSYMQQRQSELQAIANLPTLNDSRIWNTLSDAERIASLNRIAQSYEAYSNIVIFDLNGNVILQTKPESISNQAKEPYFQTILRTNKVLLSDPIETENLTVLYLSTPIKDAATGKTTGIVRATLLPRKLADIIPTQQSYSIVDHSNRLILASGQNRPSPEIFSDPTLPKSQFWENSQQHLLLTQSPITQFSDATWRIILSQPAEQLSKSSQFPILLISSLAALVSGLLAIALFYWLSHRITKVTHHVQQLSEGKFKARLNATGADDIAVLGESLDRLTDTLEASASRQSESIERFQQLNQAIFTIRKLSDFSNIVNTAAREIGTLLDVDRAIVYLFDPNWKGTIVAESVGVKFPAMLGTQIADPCVTQNYIDKYQLGQVQAISNMDELDLDPYDREQLAPFKIKANLVAPMLVDGRLIGLLSIHQCSAPREWQESETSLFFQFALHLGYAIEHVNLATERQLAQTTLADRCQEQKEVLQAQLIAFMQEAEKAASGDLTARAEVIGGEIGTVADFFNMVVENLQRIVQQVKQSTIEVNTSLNQHESAVRSLSKDALKQAEETDQSLKCIEQIVTSIHTVAGHAQEAAQISQTAAITAEAGESAVNEAEQSILDLRQSISEATKKIKRLGESTQQISKAVALINQIEMQTNVLAINAGIEATRTTEQHPGFTLIAEEVGALANRAAAATQEISQLVTTIQQETIEVVEAMDKSTSQVIISTQSVESAKQSLEQIMQVASQIDQIVHRISEATGSQVQTSHTMTDLMNTIAQVAKNTSSSSLEVSSSLRETVSVAKYLEESVETFVVQ